MILNKLTLHRITSNRDAILLDNEQREVYVPAAVLQKAYITRAWLNQTLLDASFGQCTLCAEVKQEGKRIEAADIWLETERPTPNADKSKFKNFGLELHKPQRGTDAYRDMTNLSRPTALLAKRFIRTDKSHPKPDLCNFRFDNTWLSSLDARHKRNADAVAAGGVVTLCLTPEWRLVTGMGEASVYETHLTLHPVYGIPYMPASGIKGVLRHYMQEQGADAAFIARIFGQDDGGTTQQKATKGRCVFFDAFPLRAPRIELEVMTPHYSKYYGDKQPPADWQSPNPVHFLTVGKGTPFHFRMGWLTETPTPAEKQQITRWLEDALVHKGTGAKTAVGYGYWEKIPD